MNEIIVSIDVGGTKTLVGAFDTSRRPLREWTCPTAGDDHVGAAVTFAQSCVEQLGDGVRVAAVAAGFPEYVSADGRLTSHEVLTWGVQPHEALVSAFAELGTRPPQCTVESDVRLGALGEAVDGAGRGVPSFWYVSLGTGLSSAFVIDGQVWPGARGEAIAFGEHAVPAAERANLEQYASGAGISARYRQATGVETDGRGVTARAADGDPVALSILELAGGALGDAVADIVDVLDPHAVVLGGGLGSARTILNRRAEERYAAREDRRPGSAPWIPAECGPRSGLVGGAVAAWRSL
ncbi:MAG: ROK family protein [Actinomycetales bacterium]|nr:ROK family protein [Actinomycetales bacterium]